MLERAPASLPAPPAFSQYLRAHVMNAVIAGVRLVGSDRQLAMKLRAREGDFEVLLAIFGRRSNVLLLDSSSRILAAVRPLKETRPELAIGDEWVSPASRPPTAGTDRFAEIPDSGFLQAIESAYRARREESGHVAMRRELERVLRKEARAYERKLAKIDATLTDAEKETGLEREGELLKSVLSKVERGASRVEVRDFTTGEPVVIPLDPTLSPAENLARKFKRYHKAVRSLTKAGAQQAEIRAAADEVAALEAELRERDDESLEAFRSRPEVERLLRKYARREAPTPARARKPMKLGRHEVPRRLMPRRHRTAGGLEIWVGRSDEGNDFLTTRLAAGNDLFFHLDGAPGSHVILRTGGNPDPPSEAVLDACELAVHHSKAKNATRADVHVVPIKNVKKPKGAKRGLVTVYGGKTIHLRRMQSRLARVLDARCEDDE
jgi:predicted ribosome quality control (RQC) complex YloA/Tae2 family protein